MVDRLGISTVDLRRLHAVTDPSHLDGSTESMPLSVLEALDELVRCDQITYAELNPIRPAWHGVSLDPSVTEISDPGFDEFFWRAFWSSPVCSYPQRLGDCVGVRRASDFHTARELANSLVGELLRVQGMRHNAVMPIGHDGAVDRRIEFFRADGPDFSERELLLLELLRPHLAGLNSSARQRQHTSTLTPRQTELLRLVANGMTNRQIARALTLSEGTVRRHLENAYQRLDVTSRTGAVKRLSDIGGL